MSAATDQQYESVQEYYRRALDGHVYIRETIELFLDTVGQRVEALEHTPTILALGSHAGAVTAWMLDRWPHASVLVSDDDESLVAMSRRRLPNRGVDYVAGPLSSIERAVDVVTSVARHHHLPHDYLKDLRGLMAPGSVYVMADELCPEYCAGHHAERIGRAELIHVASGYVLTTHEEVRLFEETGVIPALALELEDLRRRALWRWYRYVVDEAVERGYYDIAVGELQSTHDDLITGSDAEHKFSHSVVERQFALAGFQLLSKRLVGPADDAALQSMFVYEFTVA